MTCFRHMRRAAAVLALTCLFPFTGAHAAADSLLSWTDLNIFKFYHAYSASDGKSYIEEIQVPASERQNAGATAQTYFDLKPVQVKIGRQKAGVIMDWHGAVEYRHLIIPMQGNLLFDLGDGRTLELKPGEAILAEDWAGRGHKSGCAANNVVATCVGIDMLIERNPHSIPLRSPPTPGK